MEQIGRVVAEEAQGGTTELTEADRTCGGNRERDERGKGEEIEKGKEEQGGRARSCVLGARAPWIERERA